MRTLLLCLGLMVLPISLWAEADGPDFYRVTGVAAGDVLNMRDGPSPSANKIAEIPPDADGLRNLGACEGGLSLADWIDASEEERAASARSRWCKVAFDGNEGWVAGWHLAESTGPGARPSFDCSRADGTVEEAICVSPMLSALDNEVARLYALASTAERDDLQAMQRGWIKGRNECWKATDDIESCIAAAYVTRADELRTEYAVARSQDEVGASLGPFAYVCSGLDVPVSAVFVNTEPGFASVRWGDRQLVLTRAQSGSGARYEADVGQGPYVFWTKGTDALFSRPGETELTCAQDDMG